MPGKILLYLVLIIVEEKAETDYERLEYNTSVNKTALENLRTSNGDIDGQNYDLLEANTQASLVISFEEVPPAEDNTTQKECADNISSISIQPNVYVIKTKMEKLRNNLTISTTKQETGVQYGKTCYHIPASTSVCPPDLYYLLHNSESMCYTITEKQEFPPSCPYQHFLPYHQIEYLLHHLFFKDTLWVHAFRNTTSGFANFEWVESGLLYGQVVTDTIENAIDIKDKNCIIFKNKRFQRVSCSETHQALCMYSAERLQFSDLPKQCARSGYEKCILSSYNLTQPSCYCKKIDRSQPVKRKFCEKLAEPIFPYQTKLLARFLMPDSSMCWFGLYKDESTSVTYKWLSRNEEVSYTHWAKPDSCEYNEGAFKFNAEPYNGWALANDRTLKCAICETTIEFNKCVLQLKFITAKNTIELTIINFLAISSIHDISLYCFSDSNENDFKWKLPAVTYKRSQFNSNITIVTLATIAAYPSYYWCEAFEYSSKNVIRSNIILAYNRLNGYGHEFAVFINVDLPMSVDPFLSKTHLIVCAKIKAQIEREYDALQALRPMRANFDEAQHRMNMLIHITTEKSLKTATEQYAILFDILKSVSEQNSDLEIQSFLSSEVCLASVTLTADGEILEWPETRIGATAIPANRLCLDDTRHMLPSTRKCVGDFLYGAKWTDANGICTTNTTYSETTEQLYILVNSNASVKDVTDDLVRITHENVNSLPIDVHLVAVILERLAKAQEEEVDNSKFSEIVSNVMHFSKSSLINAQRLLNSTDKILSSLDEFMNNQKPLLIVTRRIIVQITDLEGTNVTGIALYKSSDEVQDFKSYKIEQLFKNTSFANLLDAQYLETAVLLPEAALIDIKENSFIRLPKRLIIIIFYNDLLFNEPDNFVIQQSTTKVITVTIPGFTGPLRSPIKMVFKMPKNYLNLKNCSHWKYGMDSFMVSIHGEWQSNDLSEEQANSLEICNFFHLTHFGILLQGEPKEGPYNDLPLVILTSIGLALSLIGIIPIFITAILFKTWRKRPGNIILINFCIAITIQIILMFSLHAIRDGVWCKILGASLHYIVLSEFCWMFVVALLQHRRFVMVFKPEDDSIVWKCIIIGWGFPLVPVVITASISIDNYKMNPYGFCTVAGNYYIYGYLLPIIIILCSNLFLFTRIIYSVSRQSTETCTQRSRNYKLEIILGLFLFFVLGMTWIFGLIGALGGGIWFTYIFCITATLQGLVLFVFFIIGNKETLLMWKKRSIYYMDKKRLRSVGTVSSNTTTVSSE